MGKKATITKLQGCIDALKSINAGKTNDPEFLKWKRNTEVTLEHIFGPDTSRRLPPYYGKINICASLIVETAEGN